MSRIVLVTGTDTGVGKTWVSCGLLRALRAGGRRVAACKPAETGCGPAPAGAADGAAPLVGGGLLPLDAAALAEAAGGREPLGVVCPYRFAEPLAPAVAAERAGVTIDVDRIAASCRERAARAELLLVEGAGGLLVPLRGRESFADLAAALGAALVVVVGARLGAINHALLTVEVARRRGLAVAGAVVNHAWRERDLATDTLCATLAALGAVPLLAETAHGEAPDAALAAFAAALLARPS